VKLDESFDVRTDGSDDRFELRGELDMATVRHFLDAVQPAIESARDVTLDLSRLTFMDSTGISGLFEVGRHAAACGTAVIVRTPSPPVLRVLEIVRADRFAGIGIEIPPSAA